MKTSFKIFYFLILSSTSLVACSTTTPAFYLGGIQVNEEDQKHWVSTLREHGYNTVAVTVYAHQGDWDSDNFWFSATNDGVIAEIREAKRQGLNVVLILRVALDHAFARNQFLWHGMIMPKDQSTLDSWFAKYRQFVITWSKIAENEGVGILGVGSELNSMTSTLPALISSDNKSADTFSEISPLLEFYLNEEKQLERKTNILKKFSKSNLDQRLVNRGNVNYSSAKQMISAQVDAQRTWAVRMCGGSIENCASHRAAQRDVLQDRWISIIAESRKHFSGKLTYAANFDQYQQVGFWSELDIIGINAYFPLRKFSDSKIDLSTLSKGWQTVFSEIEGMRRRQKVTDKPVIFTELGFTFRANSSLEPWSSEGFSLVSSSDKTSKLLFWKEQPIDYQERVLALESLKRVASSDPSLLKGILYWKLSTYAPHREIEPFVHIVNSEEDSKFGKTLKSFTTPTMTEESDLSISGGSSFFLSSPRSAIDSNQEKRRGIQ